MAATNQHAAWAEHLQARLSKAAVVHSDHSLAKRTTLRVGGKADLYVEPANELDLAESLRFAKERSLAITLLGRGSNLLIRDGGIRGVVVCLAQPPFSQVIVEDIRLRCGAGARLKTVAVEARRAGVAGLEFLEGIPGSVGGAMRMNAGAMGSSMFERIESLRYMDLDGGVFEKSVTDVASQYRSCPLLKTHIALSAVLIGLRSSPEEIAQRMSQYSNKRWESQPPQPSAGCIFKNPATIPAGKLVDELGLKGASVGGARVSEIHGNFIVNDGNATSSEVLRLIQVIREKARTQRGIELETEVEILGSDEPSSTPPGPV
ncbi:MAG: UDP-N-acetylmuramate dehydrogenase [Verrucomicrobia bacterium]|nr:UDP-N-acetylmuramate dehydrogenase [Verrucomicrobiota bacterium]MBI3867734.1 UDP-N-acetylmuramate dehydrogenase [Verrucomicrobiota bacterium]